MKCQHCGAQAPTRTVVFRQNIALLVIRFPSKVEGSFCRPCIHRLFWKMTLISLVAGWWGIVSFFANFFFIFSNIRSYVHSFGMPVKEEAPRDAKGRVILAPSVDFSTERIGLYRDDITRLLAAGEPLAAVCEEIARRASAPEMDVAEYIDKHMQGAVAPS